MRSEGFGILFGVHIDLEPVYLPIQYKDTPLRTVKATRTLLRQGLF